MKKIFLKILFCLLLAGQAHAQEVISSFEEENIGVLNEELRKIRSNASTTTIVTPALGGLGEDFSAATRDTVVIVEMTGNFGLSQASSRVGYFFRDDMTWQPPTGTEDTVILVSSNIGTIIDGGTTGRIALEASKQYFITATFQATNNSADPALVGMRFYNSGAELSGASDYSWEKTTIIHNGTPGTGATGDDADTEIDFGTIVTEQSDNGGWIRLKAFIDTYKSTPGGGGTALDAWVEYELLYFDSVSTGKIKLEGTGAVLGNYTINGFNFFGGGTANHDFSYRINVYEYPQ